MIIGDVAERAHRLFQIVLRGNHDDDSERVDVPDAFQDLQAAGVKGTAQRAGCQQVILEQ